MSGVRIAIVSGPTAGNSRRAATHYGRRETESKFGSAHVIAHGKEVVEFTFDFDSLPVFDLDALALRLPVGMVPLRATLKVLVPFAGGTSLAVGLVQADDGTEIDADGLIVATALTSIDAAGDYIVGGGSSLNANVALQSQVEVVAVGTFTAGKALLRVEYEPQNERDNDDEYN